MGQPFGFMGFLGVASLVGVIVSHVIVLFDFIEEAHERGEPLREALLDAGIVRLRPVMITVGATVLGLVPLGDARRSALGTALLRTDWRPDRRDLRHLILVPVLYSIFVLDLKLIKWETVHSSASLDESGPARLRRMRMRSRILSAGAADIGGNNDP